MKHPWIRRALWLLSGLLLLLIVGPFLVPVPPLTDVQPARDLADADSRFVALPLGSDRLDVHYKEAGDGEPPLLLLHGFGASLFSWQGVMGPLAASSRVIAYDRPAFGLTERPMREGWGSPADWRAGIPYGSDAQAQMAVALLDEVGVQEAVLVGHSAGGALAMLAALDRPERVRALVLISPAVYGGGGNPALQWLLGTPQMRRVGPLLVRRIGTAGLDVIRTAWHDPARIPDEAWAGYTAPLSTENWDRALWELTVAGRSRDLETRLAELTLPVLVITGDDDRIVPTAQSIRLAGELPNAELLVIPACGHLAHEECPEPALEAIARFLAALP